MVPFDHNEGIPALGRAIDGTLDDGAKLSRLVRGDADAPNNNLEHYARSAFLLAYQMVG